MTVPPRRILVVEDDPEIKQLVLRQLNRLGHDPVGSADGIYALAEVARRRPDLVITDVVMPRLEGIGLVERLRANPATQHIPVLVLTGRGNDSSEAFARSIGANDYLTKPYEMDDLANRVARLLAGRPAAEPASGVAISTMLQVFQLIEHSGVIEVRSSAGSASLTILEGELVGAHAGALVGDAAARAVLSWTDARVKLRESDEWPTNGLIRTPLADLLAPVVLVPGTGVLHPTDRLDPAAIADRDGARPDGDAPFAAVDRVQTSTLGTEPLVDRGEEPDSESDVQVAGSVNGHKTSPWLVAIDLPLAQVMTIRGAVGAALVDLETGVALGKTETAELNLDLAAAGNGRVMRSELATVSSLGLDERIEDILITYSSQLHLIRPLGTDNTLFLYLVLNKAQTNLVLARHSLTQVENGLYA